jgi:hypothetical protein
VSIVPEYIKIKPPSWRTAVTIYLEVLARGASEGAKRAAREDLLRLADIVDAMNAEPEPEPEPEPDASRWRAERRYQNAAERDELDLY